MASSNPARRLIAHYARMPKGGSGYRAAARYLNATAQAEQSDFRISDTTLGELYGRGRAGRDINSPKNRAKRAEIESFIEAHRARNPQYISRAPLRPVAPPSAPGAQAPVGPRAPGRYEARDIQGSRIRGVNLVIGVMPDARHGGADAKLGAPRSPYRGARPLRLADIEALLRRAAGQFGAARLGVKFFGTVRDTEKPNRDEHGRLRSPTTSLVALRELENVRREWETARRGGEAPPPVYEARAIFSAPGAYTPAALGIPVDAPDPASALALARSTLPPGATTRADEYHAAVEWAREVSQQGWVTLYGVQIWAARNQE